MSSKYLFIFYFIFCMSSPAVGATIGGVTVPDQITVQGTKLTLNGMAMRTFTFFDVYAASLYLVSSAHSSQAILDSDTPRVMSMHFLREVPVKKITDAWQEGLQANTPAADASLKDRFAQLGTYMESMNKGESLECSYMPGTGTTVKVKGAVKGTIPGKDFNDALLACWIGPKPGPGEKFKAGLLGQ